MAASVAVRRQGSRSAPDPWVYDALLAAGVSLTLAAFIAADIEGTRPDGWAYLWAAGFGALMFVRRTYPTLVVALSVVGFVAYYASGLTAIGTAVPIAAAVFSAAECGRLAAAIGGSAAVAVISVTYRLGSGQDAAFVLGYDLPQNLLILAGAVALGDSVRTRRQLQRQASRIRDLTARQIRRDAEERIAAERIAVSRDLHDSLGHWLAVISLHSEVAREAPEHDGGARRQALEVIRATTAEASSELKRTVAGLRGGPPAPRGPSLDSLGNAVAPAEAAGITVTLTNTLQPRLHPQLQGVLYRVVQESVTNIVRHSNATQAGISLTEDGGIIRLRIADNGRAQPAGSPAGSPADSQAGRPDGGRDGAAAQGYGLAGLRERLEALGGSFTAEWTPAGFEVSARLPREER
ncbi:sensor histidine kinase [Arthrobacter sp. Sa2BUA2]|uniref:histidine kinase n=1 Tax=Arthrobacter pullicola TaxID=2762224 RepID=A0ABR8YKN3_9MICC|nr:sensor histidine kinase [Arthrobacter pullicola]MBD8044779.1 sensor histidine kinase [Arthrobacter pullicola]